MSTALDTYLNQISQHLEEARDAMTRNDPGHAKRAVRAALAQPHPKAVDPSEIAVLTALAIGVVEPEPVADIAAARAERGHS